MGRFPFLLALFLEVCQMTANNVCFNLQMKISMNRYKALVCARTWCWLQSSMGIFAILMYSVSTSALGYQAIDAEVVVVIKKNNLDETPIRGATAGGSQPSIQPNYSEIAQKALTTNLSKIFKSVQTSGKSPSDIDTEIVAYAEVTSAAYDWRACFGSCQTFDYIIDVSIVFKAGEINYERTIKINEQNRRYDSIIPEFYGDNRVASIHSSQANHRILTKLLTDAIGKELSDSVIGAQLANWVEQSMNEIADGNAKQFDGLVPLNSNYRVVLPDGSIRKKPASKSTLVKKLGIGSIVQVIGRLPSGWLQVAKEGESIGWIHESGVAAIGATQLLNTAESSPVQPANARPGTLAAAETMSNDKKPKSSDLAIQIFPSTPVAVTFSRSKSNPDDIAVIIGNANYRNTAKDIPDVVPAYADAEGMRRYASHALGIREENIMYLKDARLADFIATFGNDSNPKGKLWNWVKPGKSHVFIYYVGHGAPSTDGLSSYLVPVDAQASLIDLSGYALKTLYSNLGKLPAKSVTVVLEACFSGATQAGILIKNASPIYQKAQQESVPANLTVITAGTGNQIASWEEDKSASLFTKHYLIGMAGAADKRPYGNGDGKIEHSELGKYFSETLSYAAQRYYGREQVAQFLNSGK